MTHQHTYQVSVSWTGNTGQGTKDYKSYLRDHEILSEGKPVIAGSSDPSFRGNSQRYNPEEMLVASLSSCHMLWYLHLCSVSKITVLTYQDEAEGYMEENTDGSGYFTSVVLKPKITIAEGAQLELAHQLHERAHKLCFIANSMNFPVVHKPLIEAKMSEKF